MATERSTPQDHMLLSVLVEVPKGSRNKYEFDPQTKRIKLDRMLFSSVHFPGEYGFIMDTLAEDGDPLDALVLVNEPTFPGCLIDAKPVGLLKMADEKGEDDKVLCVPVSDPMWNSMSSLDDVPPQLLKEIEHFFSIYKALEIKQTQMNGWAGLDAALAAIADSRQRFAANK